MRDYRKFYIGGEWVAPTGSETIEVVDPATEQVAGLIAKGEQADVDAAVAAARAAFPAFSETSREERVAMLSRLAEALTAKADALAEAVTEEMGAPSWLASQAHVPMAIGHLQVLAGQLADFAFEEARGTTVIRHEGVGVCALITPWNWPLNQIAAKVAPAIGAGCTMVLKPSEIAPFSAHVFAEAVHEAGIPAGVFNLVDGDGPGVGQALATHPDVDMVSFTGSTRAGVEIARAAAPTVKRVSQELGGKSAHIVMEGADIGAAVAGNIDAVAMNTGQTCVALTRVLVPAGRMAEAEAAAAKAADAVTVGAPSSNAYMGPLSSAAQFAKVQSMIAKGVAEGAKLVAGGEGRPEGLDTGYYVKPTVFSDVTPGMTIEREEIFGPVVSIMAYDDIADAVAKANDTPYGLSGAVTGPTREAAMEVARKLRTGNVAVNGGGIDLTAPFGGYGQSGNGREFGLYGLHEFLEVKAVMGGAEA